MVPLATISAQSWSFSACEPSTQWMESGLVSAAIFSTHLRRWLLRLSGAEVLSNGDAGFLVPGLGAGKGVIDRCQVFEAFGVEPVFKGLRAFFAVDFDAVLPGGVAERRRSNRCRFRLPWRGFR